jgi:hypothetical protein
LDTQTPARAYRKRLHGAFRGQCGTWATSKDYPDLQAIDLKAQVEEKPASEMTDAELEAEIASTAAQIRAAAREDEASADLKFAH